MEKTALFKDRLNEALTVRGMKPAELYRATGISESTISQYRSGYAEPRKTKLGKIANALRVNPAWLMGLNVSMEDERFTQHNSVTFANDAMEQELLDSFRKLSIEQKKAVTSIVASMNIEKDHSAY